MFYPQYSPDGKNVAVLWNRLVSIDLILGHQKLWLISLDNFSQKCLQKPDAPNSLFTIQWSKDTTWIFVNTMENPEIIQRISVSTGQQERFG